MKKILIGIAALVLSVMCFTGCGGTSVDPNAAAQGILGGVAFAEQLQPVSEQIALKRLGVTADNAESCIAYTGTNAVVDEFAVIKASDVDAVETEIRTHIASQIATYESYAPNEVQKLNNAVVTVAGDCVIYVVSTDGAIAQSVVDSLVK